MALTASLAAYRPRIVPAPPVAASRSSRSNEAFRPIFIQTSTSRKASGSSYVEFGGTKVVCTVYGPRASTRARYTYSEQGELTCTFRYAPFSHGRHATDALATGSKAALQTGEKELSQVVVQALTSTVNLDAYPKSALDVFISVLESDGGVLGTAITAASLALADAGVAMYDMVAVCTVGVSSTGELLLDPTGEEESASSAVTTIALMPATDSVAFTDHSGEVTPAQLGAAMSLCSEGCMVVYDAMRAALVDAAARNIRAAKKERSRRKKTSGRGSKKAGDGAAGVGAGAGAGAGVGVGGVPPPPLPSSSS